MPRKIGEPGDPGSSDQPELIAPERDGEPNADDKFIEEEKARLRERQKEALRVATEFRDRFLQLEKKLKPGERISGLVVDGKEFDEHGSKDTDSVWTVRKMPGITSNKSSRQAIRLSNMVDQYTDKQTERFLSIEFDDAKPVVHVSSSTRVGDYMEQSSANCNEKLNDEYKYDGINDPTPTQERLQNILARLKAIKIEREEPVSE